MDGAERAASIDPTRDVLSVTGLMMTGNLVANAIGQRMANPLADPLAPVDGVSPGLDGSMTDLGASANARLAGLSMPTVALDGSDQVPGDVVAMLRGQRAPGRLLEHHGPVMEQHGHESVTRTSTQLVRSTNRPFGVANQDEASVHTGSKTFRRHQPGRATAKMRRGAQYNSGRLEMGDPDAKSVGTASADHETLDIEALLESAGKDPALVRATRQTHEGVLDVESLLNAQGKDPGLASADPRIQRR